MQSSLASCCCAASGHSRKTIITLTRSHQLSVDHFTLQGNFEKPDEEELAQTAKETAAALNLVVTGKLAAAQPKNLPKQPGAATYIKYTPQQQGPQYASGARERTIKMQDMPVDPMEPPKFRHKKVSLCTHFDFAQLPQLQSSHMCNSICVSICLHIAQALHITKLKFML